MPPFIPLRALNRSQKVRIGGQYLKPNTTSYIDLGQLSAPYTPVASESATGATSPGLTKETKYFYKVTAVDNYGGETVASTQVEVTTGAGENNAGKYNTVTVDWAPVANAKEYKVYRGTESQKETYVTSTTSTVYVDHGQTAAGTATPPSSNNTYVPTVARESVRKSLAYHSSIGSYIVVGGISNSNDDWVVSSGVTPTMENLKVKTAAGELRQRSTGIYEAVGAGETTLSEADAEKDRLDLAWINTTTGAIGHTSGTVAAAGATTIPATPEGTIPVAVVLVKAGATAGVIVGDVRPRA